MRVAVFSTKRYDELALRAANEDHGHELAFCEPRLTRETVPLAEGFDAVCAFVNDDLSANVLVTLARGGTRLVLLRCAGFNQVDLSTAEQVGITVARVPAYSPHAVAEHTVGLMLALNRKIHRAYARTRESNFSIDGFMGFDFVGKTVGVVGTGKIGETLLGIMKGFGCELLATDPYPNPEVERLGAEYVEPDTLAARSDIVSLHCPLTPQTFHLINHRTLSLMKPGAMLINTSRGALVDASAAIEALKDGRLGYLGLDVYEEESDLFFQDLSDRVVTDDTFMRLLTFPNVLVTSHQAFFTQEAVANIARTTLANATSFEADDGQAHLVTRDMVA
ncbi:2-hydroxyacid dehydrogenase [Egibacter rhizosphaerae]|uniref:2-hydroxyacid dehydrogenase n=1 Tax=Egibacter rhizosphaerae TaxID=1670831 RepID=A0A411YC01_9ACTN|nr:2-hydroxyacid dehydrogenase [Egibacter rhizosphaerae]QBI18730.1 2-hydroxyacid dehydrogenase [Egibacter rhizosphaerae]